MTLKSICTAVCVVPILLLTAYAAPAPDQTNPPPLDSEYKLGPEDVVQVWVWKEPDLSTTAMVRPDGRLSLPLIGEMEARGKTAAQLQDEVYHRLLTYFSQPVVTVIVKEVNYPTISVLGQVKKPDLYKMRHRITLLDAIAISGGFTEFAKRDKVIVYRNSTNPPQKMEINLKRLNEENGKIYLQPFDTVYVE